MLLETYHLVFQASETTRYLHYNNPPFNMKLSSTLSFSVGFLALLAQANPIAEPEASVEGSLEKRDVLCKVARGAVCRWGPGESSFVRRRDVSTSDTFGVKCLIKNGAGT